ncbi:tyrosine recombinase XerC [Kurthia sibirica]|uniref:Recombinase XerC n=1 Tax=Kurthia sibirica TaxID=202750 RepID=A0A2U3AN30_9BACL|nr:tyrosine recombinase XerC [Kurthia sibirica]PWI25948.1 recombinase XerC [Kurthia sibirica]GEK35152.1 tyrosine recombinase XerC [Kurthia sibirica]
MSQAPKFLRDFLVYLTAIKGKSQRTRKEYEYDLSLFFRFLIAQKEHENLDTIMEISIAHYTVEDLRDITLEDLYLFLEYCEMTRHNNAATRARKVATFKSFFHYLKTKKHLILENPADELEAPKLSKKQPIYMNLEESQQFMTGIQYSIHFERDYCMMTLFLNLGIRVSELCALNLTSIHDDIITIQGKGDKERNLFLNKSCINALHSYLKIRDNYLKNTDNKALFLSQKGTRLTRQTISKLVRKINLQSGLEKEHLTPHKLRHTSATLLYRSGADIRSLQQILGHSNISTTQIYTHVENKEIQRVIMEHPMNDLSKSTKQ